VWGARGDDSIVHSALLRIRDSLCMCCHLGRNLCADSIWQMLIMLYSCPLFLCDVCLAAEANLLFGRGMLAGIDRREQKKQSAVVEADMLRKLREGAGISETAAMRQEEKDRRERADKYGAGDMRVSDGRPQWSTQLHAAPAATNQDKMRSAGLRGSCR